MLSQKIKKLVLDAASEIYALQEFSVDFVVERPRVREHGDFATNIALKLSAYLKKKPYEIAEPVAEKLSSFEQFEKVEVAGPGFINIFISRDFWRDELFEILNKKKQYSMIDNQTGKKVQVEFVSANPVGPMHIGHGRWAAYGDALSRLLEKTGAEVIREFYINDAGRQMDIFAESVACRYSSLFGEEVGFPEEGYRGHYIIEIAKEIKEKYGDTFMKDDFQTRKEKFKKIAYEMVLEHLKKVLESMEVHFDVWFSEKSLHESGALYEALELLKRAGAVYEKDGAVWFASSNFGDEKDRVLVRANGEPTYFLADIAYHLNKKMRGFDLVIDIWGADHHGYVPRMQAAMKALGYENFLEIIIGQMVNLLSGGKPVRMSKRTGEMVTLEELLEETGKDALRFFFVSKSTDSTIDFDIELAKEHSQKNPVYYVQYAHARICSILRKAAQAGIEPDFSDRNILNLLSDPSEIELIYNLSLFPELVEACARTREVHHIPAYLLDLASMFHSFYQKVRVITDDIELSKARLSLIEAVRIIMEDGLDIIGVSAPEFM